MDKIKKKCLVIKNPKKNKKIERNTVKRVLVNSVSTRYIFLGFC
jgi:uncharacterized protein YwbE